MSFQKRACLWLNIMIIIYRTDINCLQCMRQNAFASLRARMRAFVYIYVFDFQDFTYFAIIFYTSINVYFAQILLNLSYPHVIKCILYYLCTIIQIHANPGRTPNHRPNPPIESLTTPIQIILSTLQDVVTARGRSYGAQVNGNTVS